MSIIHTCRISQAKDLRLFALKELGLDKVSLMSDYDIKKWLEEEGYQTYIEYCGDYDDDDDILVTKTEDINELVKSGKAFWAKRR